MALFPPRAALLPTLGLCSCALEGSRATEVPKPPEPEPAASIPTWIEHDSPRAVPTVFEAAVRSGRLALAQGEWAAARESLTAALAFEESAAMMLELRLAEVDALVGQGQFQAARGVLAVLRAGSEDPAIDARAMVIREHEHAFGLASTCEAHIDAKPRALPHHDDFLAAWNDVRDGFPRKADLPIPTTDRDAQELLCQDCEFDEPSFPTLTVGEQQVWSLVYAHGDWGVSVLPELIAGTMRDACADDVQVIGQRHGDLLWVRAFADAREEFDPSDWELGEAAGLGAPAPAPYYAGGSSGYQGSGYIGGSSGYQGSGYQYPYRYYYHCGEYDYSYEYCTLTSSIERDVFIDLARGEVVLDIVRTGKPTSAMGFVRLERDHVQVDACGVQQTLPLSFTA